MSLQKPESRPAAQGPSSPLITADDDERLTDRQDDLTSQSTIPSNSLLLKPVEDVSSKAVPTPGSQPNHSSPGQPSVTELSPGNPDTQTSIDITPAPPNRRHSDPTPSIRNNPDAGNAEDDEDDDDDIEEIEPEQPPPPQNDQDRARPTIRQRVRRFFSAQGRQERKEAGIVFRLGSGLIQVAIITTILSLSATKLKSPLPPHKREWDSCSRPLGTWSALWAARIVLGICMGVWEFFKEREKLRRQAAAAPGNRTGDTEQGSRSGVSRQPRTQTRRSTSDGRATQPAQPLATSSSGGALAAVSGAFAAGGLATSPSASTARPSSGPAPRVSESTSRGQTRSTTNPSTSHRSRQPTIAEAAAAVPPPPRPIYMNEALFSRLETVLTMTALSHFVANQIFLYSSVNDCRLEAPHIWWLAFGIACLGYMVVLEIVLIAIVVFVIGPLLLLTLNLIMLCLGRQVDARGNIQIRAEIPKLDQKYVDQIPLVVFIPEEKPKAVETPAKDDAEANPSQEHTYPPTAGPSGPSSSSQPGPSSADPSSSQGKASKRPRFLFLKKKEKQPSRQGNTPDKKKGAGSQTGQAGQEDPWEAQFEKGEHPFVRLEGNRATCAICLSDFIEPRKRDAPDGEGPSSSGGQAASSDTGKGEPNEAEGAESSGKAKDASNGQDEDEPDYSGSVAGEPLRLLKCGHVFHRHCLDPWLLEVSGRCPVCQRKVVEEPSK